MLSQPTSRVQMGTGEAGCGPRGTKSCSLGICCLQGVAGEGSWGTHRGEPEWQTCLGLPPAQLCVFPPWEQLWGLRLDTVAGGISAKLGFLFCLYLCRPLRSFELLLIPFPPPPMPAAPPAPPPRTHTPEFIKVRSPEATSIAISGDGTRA